MFFFFVFLLLYFVKIWTCLLLVFITSNNVSLSEPSTLPSNVCLMFLFFFYRLTIRCCICLFRFFIVLIKIATLFIFAFAMDLLVCWVECVVLIFPQSISYFYRTAHCQRFSLLSDSCFMFSTNVCFVCLPSFWNRL